MSKTKLRIGTRTSALARVQTDMVSHLLHLAHPNLEIEVVPVRASGDWSPSQGEKRLAEAAGGKGLFIKEVEQAIMNGEVDCGVHNVKDVPSILPEPMVIDHFLQRDDARDVLIGNGVSSIADLPPGTVVGTSSMRRQSLLLAHRPDLVIKPLRGNVDTRLEKLRAGQVEVAVLAAVGLHRLNRACEIAAYLEPDEMLPACGQGILCIETRRDDHETRALLDSITHHETALLATAERAVLIDLDGSCKTPIAAHATMSGHKMVCDALIASEDGREMYRASASAPVHDVKQAEVLGQKVAAAIRTQAGPEALARLACDFHHGHAAQKVS